jgi:hypothetical protein
MSKTIRPSLRPTKSCVWWVTGDLSLWSGECKTLAASGSPVSKLRMCGALRPLFHNSSGHVDKQSTEKLRLLLVNERKPCLDVSCLLTKPYAIAASNDSEVHIVGRRDDSLPALLGISH